MTPVEWNWILRHKVVAILISLAVGVLLWWVLVAYINPEDAAHRKDVVQVFAIIIAGIVGVTGAAVGLSNVRIARENLKHNQRTLEHNQEALRKQLDHQRELEDIRAQDGAQQAYYEHIGDLLTDHDLSTTDRVDIKLLARAQTLTVAGRLDQDRKGQLLVFLYGAGLISKDQTVVVISGVDFSAANLFGAILTRADLSGADLSNADLRVAKLRGADLGDARLTDANLGNADLSGADLGDADLYDANLIGVSLIGASLSSANLGYADLRGANLSNADLSNASLGNATVTEEQLAACETLEGATMPNGQHYEDWAKTSNS